MQVSFVVPLFNCLPLTQAMVASLRTTLPAGLTHEIILVDDGSTDGTREWIAALSEPFRCVLNPHNLGYAGANNRGAALARGEYLFLLNNDLVLTPGWIEPMLAAIRRLGPRAGLVGNVQVDEATGAVDHAGIVINHKGKPEHLRRSPWLARLFRPVRHAPLLTGACFALRRELWLSLGGFDEGFVNGCEDIDLCLRSATTGHRNAVARWSRVRHHISPAPGRKARDEANTYRLTRKWRDALVELGRPAWCRHHFETYLPEPRDFPDPALARQIFWYLCGVRRSLPPGSKRGMEVAIATEMERWAKIV